MNLIYEGKAKKIFSTENSSEVIMEFKNDLTAFNALKKGQFDQKGQINCEISTLIFEYLKVHGLPLHWIKTFEHNKMLVQKTEIIPLEVVIRNRIAGSLAKKFNFKEGTILSKPLLEFYYKKDELNDPFVSDDQIFAFNWCSENHLKSIKEMALQINALMVARLTRCDLLLVDFKIEFGVLPNGNLVLADEISPDSMRIWDRKTNEKLDKDRFRLDLGDVKTGYVEILKRLKETVND